MATFTWGLGTSSVLGPKPGGLGPADDALHFGRTLLPRARGTQGSAGSSQPGAARVPSRRQEGPLGAGDTRTCPVTQSAGASGVSAAEAEWEGSQLGFLFSVHENGSVRVILMGSEPQSQALRLLQVV